MLYSQNIIFARAHTRTCLRRCDIQQDREYIGAEKTSVLQPEDVQHVFQSMIHQLASRKLDRKFSKQFYEPHAIFGDL